MSVFSESSARRITEARYRLAPISIRRFLEGIEVQQNPNSLSAEEIQERCFTVLGYLEEYFRPSSGESAGVEVKSDVSLRDLEAQLDMSWSADKNMRFVRSLLTVAPEDESFDNFSDANESTSDHRESIKKKITELLAHPQVLDKFQTDLNQELNFYQAARQPMREVRNIDRVSAKLRQALYRSYFRSKQNYGKLVQSAADQIAFFQGKLTELQAAKNGIEETASPEILGYLKTQQLLEYKKQMKETRVVLTPSRLELIDRIQREAVAGNKIFLVGATGTGKTELGVYVLNALTGGYEIVNWHEGTTPRDLFGYRELWTDESGEVQSGMKQGPIPLALEKGVGVLHDEYTGGATRTQLAEKFMMGAKPGQKIHIPGFNGKVYEITESFIEIFTGNPKDERTKQREDMDPAILRELTGVEVSYLSASEMNDIILAKLIEENGVLKLSQAELKYIEQLSQAAEMMQRIHNRDFETFTPEIKSVLGIDEQGNTETTLNTNFLDPGTLFKLFGEWELARARGQKFEHYMQTKLAEFVRDPKTLSAPEERKTLQKVLHAFGLIDTAVGEIAVTIAKNDTEKGYTLPSEMAGASILSSENPMGQPFIGPEISKDQDISLLERLEKDYWKYFLEVPAEIPPLPERITPDLIEKLKEFGMEVLCLPKLDIGTFSDLKNMGIDAFLARIQKRYPGLKVFESLSDADQLNHSVGRLMCQWYWELVADNSTVFPDRYSRGGWFAVEVLPKPASGYMYGSSSLTQLMGLGDRFSLSANDADLKIYSIADNLLRDLGLPQSTVVRMPTVEEWNLLANRKGWGATSPQEWTSTFVLMPENGRFCVGNSISGGAAAIDPQLPDRKSNRIGFRIVINLGT